MIGGKLLNHVVCTTMIKWLKEKFEPSAEDVKLAKQIKELYKTHDVTIITNEFGGWRVSVEKKPDEKRR